MHSVMFMVCTTLARLQPKSLCYFRARVVLLMRSRTENSISGGQTGAVNCCCEDTISENHCALLFSCRQK